jgi:myosin-1
VILCKQDYDAAEADELTLRAGDMITLISKDDPGWWTGTLNGAKGLFPSNVSFVFLERSD